LAITQCRYASRSDSGRDAETRLSLDAVYTALLTHSPREPEDLPERHRPRLEPDDRLLSALEQLDRHRRLVLLGDPGSGKSTFVSFVAMCLAGEALGSREVHLGRLTEPLPGGDEGKGKRQDWGHGFLMPVRVVLRDFAARGLAKDAEDATASDLWRFIVHELEECGLEDYPAQLKKELREQGGLLLLDGLDEVPEAERRRQLIKQAVESFVEGFPRCRVLLTSRTYAYQNQAWRLPGFEEAVLAPFGEGQIRRFVDRWYVHVAALGRLQEEDARGRAELLKRAVFGSDRLRFLAQRPLLLTLMASLHAWRGGSLPERRERLYADTVELLLDSWERQRILRDREGNPILIQPSLAEWLEVDRERVRQALEELAFEAHRAQSELVGTADLAEGDVVASLMRLRDNAERNPAKLMDYLSQRAGILEPRGVGVYTFPHRTFQEYLAACHLTGGGFDEERIAQLAREDPNRWREVVQLAAAKAARGAAASVWHLVGALCFRDSDDPDAGPADAWGAHLAAQVLVESADLSQVGESHSRRLERVRAWLVRLLRGGELPAPERALAGDNLARIGDPRFDPEHWYLPRDPMLGFVEIPAGPFLMGSDDRDKMAYADEKPQHRLELPTYYMARFPVTVQQFAAFVESSGYDGYDPNSLKDPANRPVARVSWYDGIAYCEWLTVKLREWAESNQEPSSMVLCRLLVAGKLKTTLPSEPEWEKAARGTAGNVFPWGPEADPDKANYGETGIHGTSSVGCFPGRASPYGCEEMSGNLYEWTRSLWGKAIDKPHPYPYNYTLSEATDNSDDALRVLRGGWFALVPIYVRAAYRDRNVPRDRGGGVGGRVALSPFTSGL
jgi:formylglycine-generating enzyme required for sulfatase activity